MLFPTLSSAYYIFQLKKNRLLLVLLLFNESLDWKITHYIIRQRYVPLFACR